MIEAQTSHLRLVGERDTTEDETVRRVLAAVAPSPGEAQPPSDRLAEQIVACNVIENMVGAGAPRILEVLEILKASDFLDAAFRRMFAAALTIHERGETVTPNAVRAHIEERAGRSMDHLAAARFYELLQSAPEERNLVPRALRIRELARRREAADHHSTIAARLRNVDEAPTSELLSASSETIQSIAADVLPAEQPTRSLVAAEAFAMAEPQALTPKISTGLRRLDDVLGGGVEIGSLTLLGAPYGTGKSAFAGCLAARAAQRGEPVFIAIRDTMRPAHYLSRMACERSGIPAGLLRAADGQGLRADLRGDYFNAVRELSLLPLVIRGGNETTETESAAAILQCLRRAEPVIGKVRLLVVDYFQNLKFDETKREFKATQLSNHGKGLAKLAESEGLAIIALVQLIQKGDNKGEIKECRAVADHARNIWHLRAASGKPQYECDVEQQELYVEKATHGAAHVTAYLDFDKRVLRYTDGEQRR